MTDERATPLTTTPPTHATRAAPHPAGPAGPEVPARFSRREDARLVTGTGEFTGDISRQGQLWLRVVRSSIAHGLVRGIDGGPAAGMPGVRAVLTARDLDTVPHIPIRIRNKPELDAYAQPVLAFDRVRYAGEPVAVVVATSAQAAEDAAERIEVDIEPLPAAVDLQAARQTLLWDTSDGDVLCRFHAVDGDFDRAIRDADVVVEEEFSLGRDTGLPLETRGLVAEWSEHGQVLDMWGPTKLIGFTRSTVAAWFGLEPAQVVCHHVDVGGMFGTRGEVYPEDFLVPWAARVTGAPVKWIEDRNEHLVSINHSRGQVHRVTVAARSSGELVGLKADTLIDLGAYARPIGGRVPELTVESLPGPYRWGSLNLTCTAMATNKTPVGTMRGPATFDTTFVRERAIDILARRLGRDPVELRRQNLITADELPYVQHFGPEMHSSTYDSGDYPRVVEALFDEVQMELIREEVRVRREAGELVGYGVAFFLDHSGLGKEESIKLELTEQGRFRFLTTASEIGQGLASMVARVGAEELGVPDELIEVVTNQSGMYDGGNGTFASRSTIFVGSAAHDAAQQMRAALERVRGTATPPDPGCWNAVAPLTVLGRHTADAPTFGFGAHLAVVRVDPETLGIVVERLGVGYDCGRAVDMASARGQLVGAAIQALGGTLLQELPYDPQGQPQATTFMDFLVPTATEAPRVETAILELPGTTSNPLGAKGIGEAGIMGVGAAVGNAVAAALDSVDCVRRLPIHPDALLEVAPPLPPPEAVLAPARGNGRRPGGAPPGEPLTRSRPTSAWRAMGRACAPAAGVALAYVLAHAIRARRERARRA
ncbi:xanthine dehydrogenase family protein molybdopterin-binding subunit [Pseudonocardia sp. H11422]|uniref:xanthine dehydrogenase family protein molybdopterin-binding subunit n=1 Tax=Pseudonocardia sp. H11422 TaxID=2835866 RepID=UPI001BDD9882|nr:xanthine dehydrogenase family protein molybdopterin-binding subunit [Pseudonocardia sp. H11422]